MAVELRPRLADSTLVQATRRALALLCLLAVPAALTIALSAATQPRQPDFAGSILSGARDLSNGANPYSDVRLAELKSRVARHEKDFQAPAYPPLVYAAVTPFSLLPDGIARLLFLLIALPLPGLALWLVDVRDWRCFGAAYLGFPLVHGIALGNITGILMVAMALAWRWRDQARRVGVVVGLAAGLKFIALALLPWLWFSGRRRAAATATAVFATTLAFGFSLTGSSSIAQYRTLVKTIVDFQADTTFSLLTAGMKLGLSQGDGMLLLGGVTAVSVVATIALSLRASEASGYAFALISMIAVAPIVHTHYFALWLIPLAIIRPRLSPLWFLPLIFWIEHLEGPTNALSSWIAPAALTAGAVWVALQARSYSTRGGTSLVGDPIFKIGRAL